MYEETTTETRMATMIVKVVKSWGENYRWTISFSCSNRKGEDEENSMSSSNREIAVSVGIASEAG